MVLDVQDATKEFNDSLGNSPTGSSNLIDTKMMLNDVANDSNDAKNNEMHTNIDKNEKGMIYRLADTHLIPKDEIEVYIKVKIPIRILKEFHKNCMAESDNANWYLDYCLTKLIEEYNLRFNLERNTGKLLFDGREPRKDVLEKLVHIVDAFPEKHPITSIPKYAVKDTVKRVLRDADSRTINKYKRCILDYAKSIDIETDPFHIDLRFLNAVIMEKLNR